MRLTHVGKGGVTLPLRTGPGEAFFPCRTRRDGTVAPAVPCILLEGESIEVPAWYVDELHLEPGFVARFRAGVMTISGGEPELPAAAVTPSPADKPRKRRGR